MPYYTISLDDELSQKGQMDLLICFWDEETNKVITGYLGSEFLEQSSAKDLKSVSEIDKTKLLQVSSNGPNVNLYFLTNLAHLREEELLDPVLNVGTCGLHVVHGSFKTGAEGSEWNLSIISQAMWRLLDRSPRRSVYENITESLEYCCDFCGHCWCEKEKCAGKTDSILKGSQKK